MSANVPNPLVLPRCARYINNVLPENSDCFKRHLLPFLPVTVRSVSSVFRTLIPQATDRNTIITLDLGLSLNESEIERFRSFLVAWRGHIHLTLSDYAVVDSGMFTTPSNYDAYQDCVDRMFSMVHMMTNPEADGTAAAGGPPQLAQGVMGQAPSAPLQIVGLRLRACDNILTLGRRFLDVQRFLTNSAGSLRTLDLTSSGMTGADLADLAPKLGDAIEDLVLDKNQFNAPLLDDVDQGSWVAPFAAALQRMNNLRTLRMSDCGIFAPQAGTLCGALVNKHHFRTLDLSKSSRGDPGPNGWGMLPQFLKNMPRLVELDISNTWMGPEQAVSVFEGLGAMDPIQLANFEELNVSGLTLRFSHEAGESLAKLLEKMRGLRKLYMNHLDVNWAGFKAVCAAVKQMDRLEVLALSNNRERLSTRYQDEEETRRRGRARAIRPREEWRVLAESLEGKILLQHLDLSYNGIGPSGASVLKDLLPTLTGLKELYVHSNSLSVEGVCHLYTSLMPSFSSGRMKRFTVFQNDVDPFDLPEEVQRVACTTRGEFEQYHSL